MVIRTNKDAKGSGRSYPGCWFLCAAMFAWLLFVSTVPLHAQATGWGTILGRVTDQSGAVVPNANIELRNESTNVTDTTVSNETGDYVFSNVIPGQYEVRVTAGGFKAYVASHLVVYVSQSVRQDAMLTVGTASQSVEVRATLPLVQTTDAEVSGVIDSQQIDRIPLNGRTNFFGLLALAPGVQNQEGGEDPRIAGNTWYNGTLATIDGTRLMEENNGRIMDLQPSLDSIAEFKVVDSLGKAEYGLGSSFVITTTKSGTNQFHGSAFEYNQIRALEAAGFFGAPYPKGQFIRNEFGGSLGGPVKRNKLFFFGSIEDEKFTTNYDSFANEPTPALLSGDFNFPGAPTITDPTTGQPFPGNQIPPSRFSAVSQAFLKYFAAPNYPSTSAYAGPGQTNYLLITPEYDANLRVSGRVDWNINAKNTLSVSYYHAAEGPVEASGPYTSVSGGYTLAYTLHHFAVNYARTLTPSLVNELTFGFNREFIQYRTLLNNNFDPCTVIPTLVCMPSYMGGLPYFNIPGYISWNDWDAKLTSPTVEAHDALTWVKGAHIVKAGFDYFRPYLTNYDSPSPNHGYFDFTGRYTGYSFADFLLGYISDDQEASGPVGYSPANDHYGFWVQDTWKATRRLTVNLGLRYDYQTQQENVGSIGGGMANWYPDLNEDILLKNTTTQSASQLAAWLAAGYPIVNGSNLGLNPGNFIHNDLDTWAPRIGLAYMPLGSKHLVVRAGYGMYYNMQPFAAGFSQYFTANNPPFDTVFSFEPPSGQSLSFSSPFPTSTQQPLPAYAGVAGLERNWKYPLNHEWSFTLESQVTSNTVLRASYIGTETEHNGMRYNINDPMPAYNQPMNPRRPYQPWGSITYVNNAETSNDQQLQLSALRRLSSGLSFEVEYSWQKWIYGSAYDQSPCTDVQNCRLDRGVSPLIYPSYLTANYVYELPVGRGKRFLSSLHGPLEALLGGWQTTGIFWIADGLPFSVTWDSSVQGWPSSRADIIGNPHVPNPSINQWFNPAAFAVPNPVQFGDSAPGILQGPGLFDWDAGLFKTFNLGHIHDQNVSMTFRTEAFDWLNHPNFGNPNSDISQTGTVGQIYSGGGGRSIQFALRLEF